MNTIVRFLIPCALLVAAGCGHHEEGAVTSSEPTTKSSTPAAEPVAYTNEKGEVFCPVMKAVTSKEKAVGYQDYEGKRYYFCCGMCPDKFKENPALYAKK